MMMQTDKTITIVKAEPNQKYIFERLIQLYMYDMTENYPDWMIGSDAFYEYDMLENFWQYPYLLYSGKSIIGFALVIDRNPLTNEEKWFMAEFFILKNIRGTGASIKCLNEILKKHLGSWCVSVLQANKRAENFWAKSLPKNCQISHESYDDEKWTIFQFQV